MALCSPAALANDRVGGLGSRCTPVSSHDVYEKSRYCTPWTMFLGIRNQQIQMLLTTEQDVAAFVEARRLAADQVDE